MTHPLSCQVVKIKAMMIVFSIFDRLQDMYEIIKSAGMRI